MDAPTPEAATRAAYDAYVHAFWGEGDAGAAATTWTGSYGGEICGTPGAKPVDLSWAVNYLFRVEQGRIVELWEPGTRRPCTGSSASDRARARAGPKR